MGKIAKYHVLFSDYNAGSAINHWGVITEMAGEIRSLMP